MKKALPVLAVSLAVNVVLVALYLFRSPAADLSPHASAPGSRPAGTGSPARPAAAVATGKLEIADAHDLVARMRAGGFPANMIRLAAQSRLQDQYFARYTTIMGFDEPVPPFWSSAASANSDPARQRALRELSLEMTAALRELLGPDSAGGGGVSDEVRARQYGDMPAEKIARLQQILQDFSQQQSDLNGLTVGGGVRLPEDNAKLAQLERDRRAAIANLLTPQELEEYDLRSSNAAAQLRSNLIAFEPTEAEYRTLFRLQQAFDEKYPSTSLAGASQDFMRERAQAQLQLKEEMAAALPPDRAADYLLATENGATSVARIVSRLELPMATVGQVMTVQKEIQARANALRADRSLSADARIQALAGLQQQANERIAHQIGSNGLAAYKSNTGSWIQNLVPPPPAPRGGTPVPATR